MRIILREVEISRGSFSLYGTGTFSEGIHLVWGPVGCGKTTLSLVLAELILPQQGELQKEGIGRTGLLMQFPEYQVTSSTVAEEVESWGAPAETILLETGLPDQRDADPLTLSRGELKRLLLTTLLHTDSDLLLLDEPFGGMDCREGGKLMKRISGISSRIVILFSHDHGAVPPIDHLWEIAGGRLIDRGTMPEALTARPSPPPGRSPIPEDGIVPPYDKERDPGRVG
ncbi:MAG: ATP-binding cassette domain-containing protein [Methanomicrobiales archaeon]|nr:ATP-binding cassette domain-containing protein [Methanomicrobiales archaeon]